MQWSQRQLLKIHGCICPRKASGLQARRVLHWIRRPRNIRQVSISSSSKSSWGEMALFGALCSLGSCSCSNDVKRQNRHGHYRDPKMSPSSRNSSISTWPEQRWHGAGLELPSPNLKGLKEYSALKTVSEGLREDETATSQRRVTPYRRGQPIGSKNRQFVSPSRSSSRCQVLGSRGNRSVSLVCQGPLSTLPAPKGGVQPPQV